MGQFTNSCTRDCLANTNEPSKSNSLNKKGLKRAKTQRQENSQIISTDFTVSQEYGDQSRQRELTDISENVPKPE